MIFGAPLLLLGLFALPAIWWLLKVTPPSPQREVFPPYRLLLGLINKQETPNNTPWWLLLLRLLMAALIILALANPIWKPKPVLLSGSQPLALIIDNGWASAQNWQLKVDAANKLLDQAEALQKNVYLVATAENENQDIGPLSPTAMKQRINALSPQPLPVHRFATIQKLLQQIKKQENDQEIDIAFLGDGLQTLEDKQAFSLIDQFNAKNIIFYQDDIKNLVGITSLKNENGTIAADLMRANNQNERLVTLGIYDLKNRRIGDTSTKFNAGESNTLAAFDLPLEIRNDAAWVRIDNISNAGATYLADARNRLYRVAILSSSSNEMTQPLLSPLYYVTKALQGHVDLVMAGSGAFSEDVDRLLAQNPSVFILGDVVNIPKNIETKLSKFIENGGTLIRFAGPNLAASEQDDNLLPVKLRHSERQLGGVMSWATPQKLAPFSKTGFFAQLPFPEDVTISRQILAEPSTDLFQNTWLSLADGTPLVTAKNQGTGKLIFIHTSPDPSWSTLPLTGFFVEMMQKLVEMSSVKADNLSNPNEDIARKPWRTVNAEGQLQIPPSNVAPLILSAQMPTLPTYNHPPGLYGTENNLYAINLFNETSQLIPLIKPEFRLSSHALNYENDSETHLIGLLLGLAAVIFAVDSFIILWMSGLFYKRKFVNSILFLAIMVGGFSLLMKPLPVEAQTLSKSDTFMVDAAGITHLAYVITGDNNLDDTSKTGLEALSQFIRSRTTIALGDVTAINLDQDELAFYPLIYWPIDANSPMPTQKAIEKINAFMRQGGTVLFDTRDQMTAGLNLNGAATPQAKRLQDILSGLNIPALEKTPPDHVISRSFFIMPDFPGRFQGSPLWIESSTIGENDNKPIHAGDGVSSILITGNDFAGAWAQDKNGAWKYPLIPNNEKQRIYAFRGGLNIVMYMLSGNYKADQVHVPALLERLGKERQQ